MLRGYSRGGVPAGRLRLPRSEMPTDRGRPDVGQRGGRAARKLLVVETTLRSLSITSGLAAVISSVRSGKGVRGATEGPLSRSYSRLKAGSSAAAYGSRWARGPSSAVAGFPAQRNHEIIRGDYFKSLHSEVICPSNRS